MMNIPLFKCDVEAEAIAQVDLLLRRGQLATGPNIAALEHEFAALLGVGSEHAVAMGDMTHALTLALQLAGVRSGDDVLTLSFNCLSSNAAISAAGAVPVWVDLDPKSLRLSLADAAEALTPATKAMVIYHVAGYPADLAGARQFCDLHGIALIEDANNALGARMSQATVGTVGDFAVFSFYPNRQINAIEGSILICKDRAAAEEAKRMRRFGIDVSNFRDSSGEINSASDIEVIGMSSPLNNINAAIARQGILSFGARLAATRENAKQLSELLSATRGIAPATVDQGIDPAYWVWMALCDQRDALMAELKSAGVQCSKLHQPNHIYSGFGAGARSLPGTKKFAQHAIALPCGWWLGKDEISHVVEAVKAALKKIA